MCYQRKPLWVLDRFNRNINVELRPVKVPCVLPLNFLNGRNGRIAEPRKMNERHEKLTLFQHEPNAVF